LKICRFLLTEFVPKLTPSCTSEQTSAHPDPPVNTPAIDCHVRFCKRTLPREDVCIDCIDKGSIKVKNKRSHIYLQGRCENSAEL
jgi:hypothetical protein